MNSTTKQIIATLLQGLLMGLTIIVPNFNSQDATYIQTAIFAIIGFVEWLRSKFMKESVMNALYAPVPPINSDASKELLKQMKK